MPKNAENRYNRRLLLQALTAAGAATPGAAQTLDEFQKTAAVHGFPVSDNRLTRLKPVLEQRWAQLRRLREISIPDSVEPHDRF